MKLVNWSYNQTRRSVQIDYKEASVDSSLLEELCNKTKTEI